MIYEGLTPTKGKERKQHWAEEAKLQCICCKASANPACIKYCHKSPMTAWNDQGFSTSVLVKGCGMPRKCITSGRAWQLSAAQADPEEVTEATSSLHPHIWAISLILKVNLVSVPLCLQHQNQKSVPQRNHWTVMYKFYVMKKISSFLLLWKKKKKKTEESYISYDFPLKVITREMRQKSHIKVTHLTKKITYRKDIYKIKEYLFYLRCWILKTKYKKNQ